MTPFSLRLLNPLLKVHIEPFKPLLRVPNEIDQRTQQARKLLLVHKRRPAGRRLTREKSEGMIAGKNQRETSSPGEDLGRVGQHRGFERRVFEMDAERVAFGGGVGCFGYVDVGDGFELMVTPRGVGGPVEEL